MKIFVVRHGVHLQVLKFISPVPGIGNKSAVNI